MEQDEIKFEQLLETVKTVNSMDRTRFLGQCIDDELEAALLKVNEYKKDAELTIKIRIHSGDRNEISILADVSKKVPKGAIRQNLYYQDSKGNLFMDDPQQLKLLDARKVEKINERRANTND